jgi:hypothetical protein
MPVKINQVHILLIAMRLGFLAAEGSAPDLNRDNAVALTNGADKHPVILIT